MLMRPLFFGWLCASTSLLSGCDRPDGNVIAAADCGLPQIGWSRLDFDPPHQAAVWHLRPAGSHVWVSGSIAEREALLAALERFSDMRPNAYVIIELAGPANCPEIHDLARDVDRYFHCSTNHCYYTGSS